MIQEQRATWQASIWVRLGLRLRLINVPIVLRATTEEDERSQ